MFVPYVKTRAQLDRISAEVTLPLILGGPAAELIDPQYLADRRVRICLRGHQGFTAAVQALYEAAQAAFAGSMPHDARNVAADGLMARLTRSADYDRLSDQFLRPSGGGSL